VAEPDGWIEVGSFASPAEAAVVAALLSGEGIPASISELDRLGLGDDWWRDRGMVVVRVRERDHARAREVLGSVSDADIEAEALATAPGATESAGGAPRRPATTHALRGRGWSVLLALMVAVITAVVVAHSCGS